ncbi:hypothetical protein Tco_0762672 [Tanacetum coccineum]
MTKIALRRNNTTGYAVTTVEEGNQSRNMEMKPDIENMTMSEYLEYEAAKERRLWDGVRSIRSLINYNEADVDSFHRNKSNTFSYPYNLTPLHTCFLPVQPYPKNYLVSTNESNDVDIENMTIAEYNLYFAKQGLGMNQLSNHSYRFTPQFFAQTPTTPNTSKKDFDFDKILDDLFRTGAKNMKRHGMIQFRKNLGTEDDSRRIKSKCDNKILLIIEKIQEANFNPTKDLKELERLLAEEP